MVEPLPCSPVEAGWQHWPAVSPHRLDNKQFHTDLPTGDIASAYGATSRPSGSAQRVHLWLVRRSPNPMGGRSPTGAAAHAASMVTPAGNGDRCRCAASAPPGLSRLSLPAAARV